MNQVLLVITCKLLDLEPQACFTISYIGPYCGQKHQLIRIDLERSTGKYNYFAISSSYLYPRFVANIG